MDIGSEDLEILTYPFQGSGAGRRHRSWVPWSPGIGDSGWQPKTQAQNHLSFRSLLLPVLHFALKATKMLKC